MSIFLPLETTFPFDAHSPRLQLPYYRIILRGYSMWSNRPDAKLAIPMLTNISVGHCFCLGTLSKGCRLPRVGACHFTSGVACRRAPWRQGPAGEPMALRNRWRWRYTRFSVAVATRQIPSRAPYYESHRAHLSVSALHVARFIGGGKSWSPEKC